MKILLSCCIAIVICSIATAQSKKLSFTSKEISRVAINTNYNYPFNAYDSNNNSIMYTVNNLPAWLHYNASSQTLSGKALKAGQYLISINAFTKTDTAHQPFMLTVYDKNTTNILCLGNSITNGVDTFNSYRRYLWQLLHAGNYNFDFIGSWSKHHMGSDVPIADFDMDNEGHSGWTFENILKPPSWDSAKGNLHEWIQTYTPDIILIELGTNDVFQCRKINDMFSNLNVIIYLLREKNNHVKIFLAQIPPLGKQWSDKKLCGNDTTYAEAIIGLNKAIAVYGNKHTTKQSPIIIVDQCTGVDPARDMCDDIHPNTNGEKIMAERWFEAIRNHLKKL
ncbi:MAG TPA: GDSL-type esterase/lipase family protein [Parafilimonas sp.]|nr:GDSL-type esterase/lipase family protein [Parafilimonas sp.]